MGLLRQSPPAAGVRFWISTDAKKMISGGEARTTNNRMELTAVIQALLAREPCVVELYSDSKYVIDALEKRAGHGAGNARAGSSPIKSPP